MDLKLAGLADNIYQVSGKWKHVYFQGPMKKDVVVNISSHFNDYLEFVFYVKTDVSPLLE